MDTAPLLELDQFFCPDGESFYFPLDASNKLRVAFWNLESNKGTIILQSGRTEFIEKYYEVISEFIDRGYAVAMMDWRGQGLSSRQSSRHIERRNFQRSSSREYKQNCTEEISEKKGSRTESRSCSRIKISSSTEKSEGKRGERPATWRPRRGEKMKTKGDAGREHQIEGGAGPEQR